MIEKAPRPAAPSGAHRAADGRIPGQECRFPNSTVDPKLLADALQYGATIAIGRQESCITLEALQSLLDRVFAFDDAYRRSQLLGPAAICMHWFWFTGRQTSLNRLYPATSLREFIATCFGLSHHDVPMDAVLAGLIARGFDIERTKADWQSPFNWAANIRGRTHLPHDRWRWVPLTALGQRGALPPIKIEFWEGSR
jgi:hypothetical protein